jgi:hypothetical protein
MRLLLIITLACITFQGRSQSTEGIPYGQDNRENFRFLTDRSLYIAGEVIYFKVCNLSSQALQEMNLSNVYYTELVSPTGYSYVQNKTTLDSNGAMGSMEIPGDIPTGAYFLKGYTKWMRNYGPDSYSYLSVEIINPYTRTVLPVDTTTQLPVPFEKRDMEQEANLIVLKNLEGVYERRARVLLELSHNLKEKPLSCCVSVVRSGIMKGQMECGPLTGIQEWDHLKQIPETRGISMTGQVQFNESGLPASYAVVYVSLLGEEKTFYTNYADSSGRFYFSFPEISGATDLFLSANHEDRAGLTILVEQDFCHEPVVLPSFPAIVDLEEHDLVKEISVHAQINERYKQEVRDQLKRQAENRGFFYGHPPVVIQFDEFIKLPMLEEYFTELTPQVSLRKSGGKRRFRVLGKHPDLDFYPPLLMIDGVAIFDVDAILDISPRYVDRLEIVDAPYIRGNVTFGGIINIITRNEDMGFVDLPASGLLLNYHMLDQGVTGLQDPPYTDPRIPDLRNNLFWDPDINLAGGESRTIDFHTGDAPGKYDVAVRGYLYDGTYFHQTWDFEVH